MDLSFNSSISDELIQHEKDRKWVWVAKSYQYVFRYPENVDVFSFGLLKAKQDSFGVQISMGNVSKACISRFDIILADYISHVLLKNRTFQNKIFNLSTGYICHSNIADSDFRNFISNISAVKIGYSFVCYMENTPVLLEKSYMNGIVIFIVLFVYSFFPFIIEMAFYIEDRKINDGYFFKSESPYSPSVIFTRILFYENNKYIATLRIIGLLVVISFLGLIVKALVYNTCQCSLKSSNRNTTFLDAENFYQNRLEGYFFGVIHFFVIIWSIFSNSRGDIDTFIVFDFFNIFNRDFFLKTVNLSTFILKQDEEEKKYLVSLKMKKLSLLISCRFWLQIFFISFNARKYNKNEKCCIKICCLLLIIQFFINVPLILCSSLCPIISNVYLRLLCTSGVFKKQINEGELHWSLKGILGFGVGFLSHLVPVLYLFLTFKYSFNIFFYGISYALQFFLFTLLLAIPQLPTDSLVIVIFIASVLTYISRFIFQFVELYKTLLETILEIRGQNKIPIEVFNRIVAAHFPLANEIFFLLVKILFCCLFFAIVFENLQTAGYISSPFGVSTVMSLIIIFGPPRLVEELLMSDFTSRVHLKEEEIIQDLQTKKTGPEINRTTEKIHEDTGDPKSDGTIVDMSSLSLDLTEEEKQCRDNCKKEIKGFYTKYLKARWFEECREKFLNMCCRYECLCCSCTCKYCFADETFETENSEDILICKRCKYIPRCFLMRWCCIFCFGCCGCSFDDKGRLKCFHLHSTDLKPGTKDYRTVKCYVCCVKHEDENQILDEDMDETEVKQPYEEKTEPKQFKSNENDEEKTEPKQFQSNENDDSKPKVTQGEDNKSTRTEDNKKNERECQVKANEETKNICKTIKRKRVANVHNGAKKNQSYQEIELETISLTMQKSDSDEDTEC